MPLPDAAVADTPAARPAFTRRAGVLTCDDVSMAEVAAAVGTPVYVYSADAIRARYRALDEAFGSYPHAVHYALKANSTLAIVCLLRELGAMVDGNSIWELEVAQRAGFDPSAMVFTGVGKTVAELRRAVGLGVKAINVESAGELDRVEQTAAALGTVARVAIRVNPDIDARSHPHISTGLKVNKFGIAPETAHALATSAARRGAVRLVALHIHVGSQITSLDPLRDAARFLAASAATLKAAGIDLEYLDLGGGLGIAYNDGAAVAPGDYVRALVDEVAATGLPIVIEPGRSIVGPAGALIGRVVDIKPRTDDTLFAVLDAGMTELMRPALYSAYHRIEAVAPRADAAVCAYDVVGPVCESSDVLGGDRRFGRLEPGDLLAVLDAGAYGSAMASNYNRRPLPAEVLVDAGAWRVVRRRQTVDDMLAQEI